MLLILLVACGEDSCEREQVDIADDAPAGELGYTAGDVVAFVVGTYDFSGSSDANRAAAVTVRLARGEGSATLDDATLIRRFERDDVDPFFIHEEGPDVSACFDDLVVPMEARVTIPEMNLDVTFPTVAHPRDQGPGVPLTEVWVSGTLPADTATLPYPPDGVDKASFVATFDDGQLTRFVLEWLVESSAQDGTILQMNWFDD